MKQEQADALWFQCVSERETRIVEARALYLERVAHAERIFASDLAQRTIELIAPEPPATS